MQQRLTPEERAEIQQRIVAINLRLTARNVTPDDWKTLPAERKVLEKKLADDGKQPDPWAFLLGSREFCCFAARQRDQTKGLPH